MSRPAHDIPNQALTERELLILRLLADGMSNRDIAEHLWLSVNTVKWHIQRLFDKLQVKRRTQAIAAGRSLALLDAHSRRDGRPERSRLPAQLSSFIGRGRELGEVRALLRRSHVRLATLTGPAGAGKTRLSLQAAVDLLDEYEHGVHFVALAPVTDPDLVIPTIASTLKVREAPDQTLLASLKEYLHDKTMLLVLDNFEQVVGAAPVLSELLSAAPRLKIMVSSRERLRISGEHDYPVPPMGLPEPGTPSTVEALSQYEAVALFIQRAKAAKPDFKITDENAPAVAEVCIRLDGLPLPIELAAARSRLLTPQALLERLSSRLKALSGGPRDLPARQQTLRSAIDWSYNLLDEGEKSLFARLSVFSGGWTLDAAEAVCGGGLPFDIVDGLASLLDKSLIRPMRTTLDEPRYTMLETLREYAAEKLAASGEDAAVREQHAIYVAGLAESTIPLLLGGAEFLEAMAQLETEHDNVRAALGWSLDGDHPEFALRIASVMWRFWQRGRFVREGYNWLTRAIRQGTGAPIKLRAEALRGAGNMAGVMGEISAAQARYEEARALSEQIGDEDSVAAILNNLGNIATVFKDYDKARLLYRKSLSLARKLDNLRGALWPLLNLSRSALYAGDLDEARDYAYQTRAEAQRLAVLDMVVRTQWLLGTIAVRSHELPEARTHLIDGLSNAAKSGDRGLIANFILSWAEFKHTEERPKRATQLFSTGLHILDESGVLDESHELHQAQVATLRDRLGDAAFETAWAEGRAMSMAQAIQYALLEEPHR